MISRYGFFVANYGGFMKVPENCDPALVQIGCKTWLVCSCFLAYQIPIFSYNWSFLSIPCWAVTLVWSCICCLFNWQVVMSSYFCVLGCPYLWHCLEVKYKIQCDSVKQMFEMSEEGFVGDVAGEVGLVTYPTGGRALVSLPLISQCAMDIFAGNEVTFILKSQFKPSFREQIHHCLFYAYATYYHPPH